jgi:hypothetical protein
MPTRNDLRLYIGPADKEIFGRFYGQQTYWRREIRDAFYGEANGEIVAIAGVWRDPSTFGSVFDAELGRWLAFFDVKPEARAFGARIVKAIDAYLRTFEGDLYAHHDDRFPEAARILRILKFKPTDELTANPYRSGEKLRVWKRWQE